MGSGGLCEEKQQHLLRKAKKARAELGDAIQRGKTFISKQWPRAKNDATDETPDVASGDRPEGSYAAATGTGCPDPLYVRLSTTTPCVTFSIRRTGLATKLVYKVRPATSMLPCPGISSEVRPKSPHVSRLRPAPSPVPRVQDNVTFKGETPHGFEALRRWVALFGDRAAIE